MGSKARHMDHLDGDIMVGKVKHPRSFTCVGFDGRRWRIEGSRRGEQVSGG